VHRSHEVDPALRRRESGQSWTRTTICRGESCWLNSFDPQLIRSTGNVVYPSLGTTSSARRRYESNYHDNPELGLATPGVVRDDVWLYQYVLVERVSTVPSSSLTAAVLAFGFRVGRSEPGSGWRLPVLYETMFGSTSTCSSRAFQRYHPRVRQPPSWHPAFESAVQNQVLAGDSRGVRRPSSARSLRTRRRRLNGAMYEFDCCRVP